MSKRVIACGVVGALVVWIAAAQDKPTDKAKPAGKDKPAVYTDKDYSFKLTPPAGWDAMPKEAIRINGEARAAWSPDGVSTIVAFVQKPDDALTPRFLLDSSVQGMKTGLKAEVKQQEVRTVAGHKAMWMVIVADGTGGALTGQGPVKTAQHWVAIPREKDIVILLLTSPESDLAKYQAPFEEMLKTLEVKGEQTKEQKEST